MDFGIDSVSCLKRVVDVDSTVKRERPERMDRRFRRVATEHPISQHPSVSFEQPPGHPPFQMSISLFINFQDQIKSILELENLVETDTSLH
jgi:hypothetical protein